MIALFILSIDMPNNNADNNYKEYRAHIIQKLSFKLFWELKIVFICNFLKFWYTLVALTLFGKVIWKTLRRNEEYNEASTEEMFYKTL